MLTYSGICVTKNHTDRKSSTISPLYVFHAATRNLNHTCIVHFLKGDKIWIIEFENHFGLVLSIVCDKSMNISSNSNNRVQHIFMLICFFLKVKGPQNISPLNVPKIHMSKMSTFDILPRLSFNNGCSLRLSFPFRIFPNHE